MSFRRLIINSLFYHGRANLALALGIAVGAAVLTGALLVGDSMRGSLRHLTLDRLGRIDEAVISNHFFRETLASEMAETAAPVLLLQVSIENAETADNRVRPIELLGCDSRFWKLGSGGPLSMPKDRQVVLNRPLAERLGVRVGDAVLLRMPRLDAIPADSALGRKQDAVQTQRLTVGEIIEAKGLGRFALRPTQQLPCNAYVPLDWLQRQLDQPGRVNAVFIAGKAKPLTPQWIDYGLNIERTPSDVWSITSERMLLDPQTEKAIIDAAKQEHLIARPALTYLANSLACKGREIPYSTITAMDFADRPPLGPDEIALNTWAADDLHAKPGDTIVVRYFEPESIDGQVREKTAELRLAAVVPLIDRSLTPAVRGITDELTMAQWNPPFPFDAKRIRSEDEAYWKEHGPAPKAFVSLATGRKLWASRFGNATSLRIADAPDVDARLLAKLDSATMGLDIQPIRQKSLLASAGATPFGVLFLALSFFLIAAAVLLVALLFQLNIEQRAKQIGTFRALGFQSRLIVGLLLGEGLVIAAVGGVIGVPLGIGYASLMLWGLRTCWLGAVGVPFLQLHCSMSSIVIGFSINFLMVAFVIHLSAGRFARMPPYRLLAGRMDESPLKYKPKHRWLQWILVFLAIAPTAFLLAMPLSDEVQTGAFFASGAWTLVMLLALMRLYLSSGSTSGTGMHLASMAMRNLARAPGRSMLTVAIVASATFMIVAIGAFRMNPIASRPTLSSGDGGFALAAETVQPVCADLNSSAQRRKLGFSKADEAFLHDTSIFSLRVQPGDDASCLNLYKPQQPRVLGVPQNLMTRGGFAWADKPRGVQNPWTLLDQPADDAIPVILEKNTANYALNLWGGLGQTLDITDGNGRPMRLRVVALLAGSIFEGNLLIGETDFLRHFPNVSGYRFFLVETKPEQTIAVQKSLERALGDLGCSAETTGRRRATFLTIQNTYLATFQSLGGLGLLLGTLGLAAVQLRNVFERRGELALLQAVGFRRRRLLWLVLLEHATLLVLGLGIGAFAATLVVLPHLAARFELFAWFEQVGLLGAIFVLGLVVGLITVHTVAKMPLVESLREE